MTKRVDASVNPPWYVNVIFDVKWRGRLPLMTGAPLVLDTAELPESGCTETKRKRMPDLIVRWEVVLVSAAFRTAI
ncbi:MAG: hypothetical protein AAF360_12575, partial [Pseudomonadota bacterium]